MPALHTAHAPAKDLSDGYPPVDHPEVPDRVRSVLDGFSSVWDTDVRETKELALDHVRRLHDGDYVDYLLALAASLNEGEEHIPAVFHPDLRAAPLRFRAGMYCAEIGTPIVSTTIDAALNSAAAAALAARHALDTSGDAVALCRPPGHHAGRRRYGGYCYFNNAYVAASVLSETGQCAVLDVDYHLGDGSLEFASEAAPYFSLHADPWKNYPHADASLAVTSHATLQTLPDGTDGRRYLTLLEEMLQRIEAVDPDFLVLSLGFDTAATDRIQDARVGLGPEDFLAMGQRLAQLRSQIVIVLEGGYDLDALGVCAARFACGFSR